MCNFKLRDALIAVTLFGALGGCASYRTCDTGGCTADAKITAEVEAQLARRPALEPPNILTVQTYNRVVFLYGQVDTYLESELAASLASEVPGVAYVVNSIGVSNKG